jgi:enterochelin esterase family protein
MLRPLILALLGFFFPSALLAQTEFRSPDIAADGHVTFRLQAPNAQNVALRGQLARPAKPLTKNEDGVWSLTMGPLESGVYSYWFDVDGTRVVDPRNRYTKQWLLMESAFEMPGGEDRMSAQHDVPSGTVTRHTYKSDAREGDFTAYFVYTPPGYDPRGTKRYPVVFLLHGFGDDERAWQEFGRANVIADNLIADGQAIPAIVVMPHGHPEPIPFGSGFSWDFYGPANHTRMNQQVVTEILPQVDSHYLTKTGRDHQAIVGLSMGGGHALGIGSLNLDTFAWIGGFSSGGAARDYEDYLTPLRDIADTPSVAPHLLWIGCGEDDFLIETNRNLVAWLEANDVAHTYVETAGNHSWPIWRDYWERFLPLLFKDQ